jgi:hypothetical protein
LGHQAHSSIFSTNSASGPNVIITSRAGTAYRYFCSIFINISPSATWTTRDISSFLERRLG